MTTQVRNEINQKVISFKNELKIPFPIDFMNLIKDLKGKLERNTDTIDAKIVPDGNNFVIYLENDDLDNRRTRFSIAHELGHLILHMNYNTKERCIVNPTNAKAYNRLGYDIDELEANEFAAALLMPKDEFKYKADEFTNSDMNCDLRKLSDYFKVSPQAALTRGKLLGIFEW